MRTIIKNRSVASKAEATALQAQIFKNNNNNKFNQSERSSCSR